jgi:alginate production protein
MLNPMKFIYHFEYRRALLHCARSLTVSLLFLLILVAAPISESAHAGQSKSQKGNDRVFDLDAPPKPSIRLTYALRMGINVGFEAQLEDNFDLTHQDDDDLMLFLPSVEIAFRYMPVEWLAAFIDMETAYEILENEEMKEAMDDEHFREEKTKLQIKQANLLFNEILPGLDVKAGRQRFKDEREWIYDEELDGVRIFYGISRFCIDFSASKKNDSDLLHGAEDQQIINYALFGNYSPFDDNILSAYVFYRDDRSEPGERPIFYGLSLIGEATKHLDYWVELAYVSGKSESRDIEAMGVDAGTTYEFDLPLKPSVTVGYAFGTGDDDPADDVDKNFRQTGLQDNNAAFNGITKFKYYGEVFDPELSNLGIATAGIGFRLARSMSLDLVYHYYYQQKISNDIRDSNLDTDPDGLEKELGHEVDVILGLRGKKHFQASFITGCFFPGKAFPDGADEALFAEVRMRIFF